MADRNSEQRLALFDTARPNRRYWVSFGLPASGSAFDFADMFKPLAIDGEEAPETERRRPATSAAGGRG